MGCYIYTVGIIYIIIFNLFNYIYSKYLVAPESLVGSGRLLTRVTLIGLMNEEKDFNVNS